ncbi:flavodoxin [Aggregatibacter kilianii]|uniref:flavodoxin n=1 Tax=Aggregatibacter kilianii TaxID=2025884 RepID=UPI000D6540B6|nr:flavodoxin [Aggregatibacter kilianii]
MKKATALFTGVMLLLGAQMAQAKNLIVYFTHPESIPNDKLDGVSGASKIIKDRQAFGATEYLAREIQKNVGGDFFRIETVQRYPDTHKPLLDFAQAEQRKGTKPALKAKPNLADYDTIFVGYPIWWYQMPMAMYSFFEQNDFSGKTLIPFVAHGGSRFSGSLEEIRKMQPKANMKAGFEVYLHRTTKADSDVERDLAEWLKKLQ